MIPKIIHYIWLGKGEKPKIFEKCFASWKKYCPDYEFMLWDESNVDLDFCPYIREAYDAKKFAFVSDVIRFQKLYEYGGIYLDIDVELLKPIDDLLNQKCFMGFESAGIINPGIICGSESKNLDFEQLIKEYSQDHFIKDGKMNLKTICTRVSNYYKKYGLTKKNKVQVFDNITIYPTEYFCPMSPVTNKKRITSNTYSIHWYFASWFSPWQNLKKRIKKVLNVLTFGLFGKILAKIRRK